MAFRLATRAGSVPGRKSGDLVQEEQLGVAVLRKWRSAHDTLERWQARHPGFVCPSSHDLAICVVQDAAVPHERSTIWHGAECSPWIDTILEWPMTHLEGISR